MKKHYKFKQGFENKEDKNISFVMKLTILSENVESKDICRLITTLDTEYQQLLKEKCKNNEGKEFKEWQVHLE